MNATVRIIILNYNRADLTLQCVASVLAQQEPDCEVVVVDNHSEPASYERLLTLLPAKIPVIRTAKNQGFAAGNNQGIGPLPGLSDARFYLFLNNDVTLTEPGTIARLREALMQDGSAAAVSPLVHTRSNPVPVRRQIQVRRLLTPGRYVASLSAVLRRLPGIREWYNRLVYSDLVPHGSGVYPVDTINGSAFMIRSDYFDRQYGFDTGTFLYEEELILGEQIRRAGRYCLLHGGIVVAHEQGATTGQKPGQPDRQLTTHQVDSLLYYLRRYHQFSRPVLLVVWLGRWIEFTGKWLLYRLK